MVKLVSVPTLTSTLLRHYPEQAARAGFIASSRDCWEKCSSAADLWTQGLPFLIPVSGLKNVVLNGSSWHGVNSPLRINVLERIPIQHVPLLLFPSQTPTIAGCPRRSGLRLMVPFPGGHPEWWVTARVSRLLGSPPSAFQIYPHDLS